MYDMQQRGLVRFVTAPLLRQMGEYSPTPHTTGDVGWRGQLFVDVKAALPREWGGR